MGKINTLRFIFVLALLMVVSISCAQKSPRKVAKGTIGTVAVLVDYGSPSVKERVIWGGLEKYGKVWRAGANENTTISFDSDVEIGDNKVPAGKYGFFIIPNKEDNWEIVFNTKNDGWGTYSYKQEEDLFRMKVKPEFVGENQEALSYKVADNGILFAWEKARILIPVK